MEPDGINHFDCPEAFRSWLKRYHSERDELWVGFWKISTRRPSITWPESVDAYRKRTEENSERYSFEREAPATLSDDYLARLQSDAAAWADWQSRPPGYRRQVSHWVMSAKRESTRERRLQSLIENSAGGRRVKPLRQASRGG